MSSASCYTNRRKVIANASVNKVEYPGSIATYRNAVLSVLNCVPNFLFVNYRENIRCPCKPPPPFVANECDILDDSGDSNIILDGNLGDESYVLDGMCILPFVVENGDILEGVQYSDTVVDGNTLDETTILEGNIIFPTIVGGILEGDRCAQVVFDGDGVGDAGIFDGNRV